MATSGKRFDWRIIVGIGFIVAALVAVAAFNAGPGPAILLALPGGGLIAAGVRASQKTVRSDNPTPPGGA